MAQMSQDKIRAKMNQVRQMVPNSKNDDIVLVLQYYDNDVERTIAAFLEDGAREALQQWHYSGTAKPATNKKKKKKNKGSKNAAEVNGMVNGVDSLHNGCNGSNSGESVDTASGASTPDTSAHILTMPNVITNGHVTVPHITVPCDEHVSPVYAVTTQSDLTTHADPTPVTAVPVGVTSSESSASSYSNATPVIDVKPLIASAAQKSRSSASSDYQQQSKKARDRTASETEVRPVNPAERPTSLKKPHAGLEKSCKDLHRQTVSLERLRVVLNDNVDKSFKRINEVFKELHQILQERESQLTEELTVVKKHANEVLEEQQSKAAQLRQQTDRAQALSEHDLGALRANIKHFVGERKSYEDLSMAQRFTCEVGQLFEDVRKFGEVIPVRLSSDGRRPSTSSSASGDFMRQQSLVVSDGTDSPAIDVNTTTSLHVLMQSDSLTRYELETKVLPAGDAPTSKPSTSSTRSPRNSSGRGRGSGGVQRGGGRGRRGARPNGERSLANDPTSRGPNYSASRTFVSRTLPNGSRDTGIRDQKATSPEPEKNIVNNRSSPQKSVAVSGDVPLSNGVHHESANNDLPKNRDQASPASHHGQSQRNRGGRGQDRLNGSQHTDQKQPDSALVNGKPLQNGVELPNNHEGLPKPEDSSNGNDQSANQAHADPLPQRNNNRRSKGHEAISIPISAAT